MKKFLIISIAALVAVFTGCKEDFAPPTVSSPAAETVEVSSSVDLTFNYTADAGFKSSSVTATNGTATVTTDATNGETTGSIVVSFTAGSTSGAGSVTITIMDAEDQAASATGVLTVFEEGAPEVTAPASTSVQVMESVDVTFAFSGEGGYSSASVTAENGTAEVSTEPSAGATSGDVVVTFTAGRTADAGSVTLTVTDDNGKSSLARAVVDVDPFPTVDVDNNIASDVTWTADNIYILGGRITVLDGATLTIEEGTVIKARAGSQSNAKALMIARGGKLMAEGTASAPIIFTTVADEILPGEIESPNMDPTINGAWGGLLVLGKAPISADNPSMQIEGVPPSDENGLYGGTVSDDNSGVIEYISIRHGGANIGEGNEINGLTLAGVGSGTTISHVEIVSNQDDGVEWFGGSVSVSNVVVWNTGDDAIDADQSWSGTVDNIAIVNPGDECFELDGAEGTMEAQYTIKNVTAFAGAATKGLVDNDPNTWVAMDSIYFFGMDGSLSELQTFDEIPTEVSSTFTNFEATIPSGKVITDFFPAGLTDISAVAAGQNTVGCDVTAFDNWSWAAVVGGLSDF